MSIPTYTNPSAQSWTCSNTLDSSSIQALHKQLPLYAPTPLIPLPHLAVELGISQLYVKDESARFGLPASKILGASWAIYRTLTKQLGLADDVSLSDLAEAVQDANVSLVACSEGNWGRAVARMARYLKIPALIFVSEHIGPETQNLIAGEGATCMVHPGDYDAAITAARQHAETSNALLVMDTSWHGYEEIPQLVTDGYSTMLYEVEEQLLASSKRPVDIVICSVGVGSWAHAVVKHYKDTSLVQSRSRSSSTMVVTVEPDVAASLNASLYAGQIKPITTGNTIMCGMCCGTTSIIAWPYLRDGVDRSVVITDTDSHRAVRDLEAHGVRTGPCGAAPLAALRKLLAYETVLREKDPVVVLFSTEGHRAYSVPEP